MTIKSIDYGRIIDQAKNLTFKHKWLWVIGFALALFGDQSVNFNSSSSNWTKIFSPDRDSNSTSNTTSHLFNQLPQVLSATTSAASEWLHSVPVSTWLYLGFVFIVLVIIGIVVKIIVTTWAKGALIGGIDLATHSQTPVTLPPVSHFGFVHFKRLFFLSLIEFVLFVSLLVAFTLLLLVSIFLFTLIQAPLLSLFIIIPLGLVFVVVLFLFSLVSIYAQRLVVLHKLTPWAAWKRGLSLSKDNLIPTLVMGLLNRAIGCAVGCLFLIISGVIFLLPAILILLPVFASAMAFTWVHAVILLLLFITWASLSSAVGGISLVFNYSSWNLFVTEILAQEAKL